MIHRLKHRQGYVLLAMFIILAYVLLPLCNADYLYTIQDNSVFLQGNTFMKDMVTHYGGWATWAACFLTQLFYYPWLGSTIMIALWIAIYAATCWLFSLKGWMRSMALIAPLLLLLNVLDYGYWIYYAKTPGFVFGPTLMVLATCAIACASRAIILKAKMKWANRHTASACLIIAGAAASLLIGSWRLNNHSCSITTTLFDKNFRHEMSMYRALDEWRFDDVIEESKGYGDEPTNLMVMYKNIALLHTGRLAEMFEINNCGIKPDTHDAPKIRTSRLGAALVYYMYGKFNYSYRWAMENAVQYGQSFRSLRMMARCAIMNGEYDVAAKYLTLLKSSLFHRDWAKQRTDMLLNSTLLIQSEEYKSLEPLMGIEPDTLDNDNNLCEAYLIDIFSEIPETTADTDELAMCMSLWGNNAYAFCVHFYDYANRHMEDAIPALYQQGAILLGSQPESPITLDGFAFDPMVANKYNMFVKDYQELKDQGVNDKEAGYRLKSAYGDTYWWYYYFSPDIDFY